MALTGPRVKSNTKRKEKRQQTKSRLTGLMAREPGPEATLVHWVACLCATEDDWAKLGSIGHLAYFQHATAGLRLDPLDSFGFDTA